MPWWIMDFFKAIFAISGALACVQAILALGISVCISIFWIAKTHNSVNKHYLFPHIALIANSIHYTGLTFFFKNIIAQSHSVCNKMHLHAQFASYIFLCRICDTVTLKRSVKIECKIGWKQLNYLKQGGFRNGKSYTDELKETVITQYEEGRTSREICAEYGILRSTLFLWKKQYTTGETSQISRERYLLEKELDRLRTENMIFKTCGCSPASPLPERLSAIDLHQEEFSIHALCRVLQVNRSTYYHHAFRSPDKTQLQIGDEALKPLIA